MLRRALIGCVLLVASLPSMANDTPFRAPLANPLEARVGSMVQFGAEALRLDIGASIDLDELVRDSTTGWLRVGTDVMTFTRLNSVGNFKFPVETTDFFFGFNATWSAPQSPLHARLRIAHISSHLVDGYADTAGVFSRRRPFVYSREFAELLAGWTIGYVRPYAGLTYVWARQPRSAEPLIPQAGIDVRLPITKALELRGGYDWKLIGINGAFQPAHAAQLGVFVEMWNGRGILVSAYGYDGRSMHGMFFDQRDSYFGLGFQVQL
jgi:hypothetical protein